MTARIPLRTRYDEIRGYAIVDAGDAELVNQWRWNLSNNGYASRPDGRDKILLHRFLLGLAKGDRHDGDHINRNKLDCRRKNLRALPRGTNSQNVPAIGGSSAQRGVSWDKKSLKWVAQVSAGGRHYYFGLFDTEERAAEAARAARAELLPFAVD